MKQGKIIFSCSGCFVIKFQAFDNPFTPKKLSIGVII